MRFKKKVVLVLLIMMVIITLIGMVFESIALTNPIGKTKGSKVYAGWITLKNNSKLWCINHGGSLNSANSEFTVGETVKITSKTSNKTERALAYILAQDNTKDGSTDKTKAQQALWTLIENDSSEVGKILKTNKAQNKTSFKDENNTIYKNALNFAKNTNDDSIYSGKVVVLTRSGKQTLLYGKTTKTEKDTGNPPTSTTDKCNISIQKYITKVYKDQNAYETASRDDNGEMNDLEVTRRGYKLSDAIDDEDYHDPIVPTNIDKFNGKGTGNYGNCALKVGAINKDENPVTIKQGNVVLYRIEVYNFR